MRLASPNRADSIDRQKIRKRYLASPVDSDNIQDLVRSELKAKSHTATEGLVWLVR